MVYAGPSRGCSTCKKRRIKCDLSRPFCQNCSKRRLPCPGVPDPPGIQFRDETETVIQLFQGGAGANDKEGSGTAAAEDYEYPNAVVPNLGEDENFVSLCFFFHNYMMSGRGVQSSRGLFEHLIPYYQPTDPDSLISVATASLTATMLSMWRGRAPDSILSRRYYGRAIDLLKDTLKTPHGCQADTTLIAIIALQFREALIAHRKMAKVDGSHQRGAYAVVSYRKSKGFCDMASKRLLQEVRSTMVSEAIRTRQPVQIDPAVWEDDGPMPYNPASDLDQIAIDLANLQALFEQYKTTLQIAFAKGQRVLTAKDLSTIASFRRTAAAIDQRLQIWASAQYLFYSPFRLTADEIPESVRKAGLYGDFCNVYPTVQIAGVWHAYNSYRLLLVKMMLCADQTVRDTPREDDVLLSESEAWRKAAEETLQHGVDEICAAVPFHLGNRTDPGSIHELSNTADIEYPWPSPSRDPYSNPCSPGREYAREHNVIPLSGDERKRQNLCMGGYNILGPMAFVLGLAGEPLDLTGVQQRDPPPPILASLLRQDQIPWLAGQMRRALKLHRIRREQHPRGGGGGGGSKANHGPPNNRTPPLAESSKPAAAEKDDAGSGDVALDVVRVKKSMKYSFGV
ncbi:uncharacterized protein Z519_10087 [Cladophialophora bantiana CBS 173.52]|uniref:Zn(2)-C6 fungal-type domain-containing protein n=1 Tax=Cladophialophora bantiana (strain ATCC 10958 / CBS 173.52 / CDC B-1940 / NIH 8579) TaxID=1442370 RepID=A0A0D2HX96_CLAB1|nr:uncharacterized protein Z519_10087 [Cladophialophora bantiana CBS 173.52]KIW89234.1 hypothetical protein Z519_10087 [Cladophialophora bantiana CBS 173.52]